MFDKLKIDNPGRTNRTEQRTETHYGPAF
jgi:hypothetical protein